MPASIAMPATANFSGDRVGCDAVSTVVDVHAGRAPGDLLPDVGRPLPHVGRPWSDVGRPLPVGARADAVE